MVKEDFTVEMLHLNKNWKEMSESGGTQKKNVPGRWAASAKSPSWDHAWHVQRAAGRPMCLRDQSKQAKERHRE